MRKNKCLPLFALLLSVVFVQSSFAGSVDTTYYTQRAEKTTEQMSEIVGYVSMTYSTGGVDWPEIENKFKALWSVDFEPNLFMNNTFVFSYNRVTQKIEGWCIGCLGGEITDTYQITNTYFTAKGKK